MEMVNKCQTILIADHMANVVLHLLIQWNNHQFLGRVIMDYQNEIQYYLYKFISKEKIKIDVKYMEIRTAK